MYDATQGEPGVLFASLILYKNEKEKKSVLTDYETCKMSILRNYSCLVEKHKVGNCIAKGSIIMTIKIEFQ